jgi:hypothetical protein
MIVPQEYRQIRTVVRRRDASQGHGVPFFSIIPEVARVEGPTHCEVPPSPPQHTRLRVLMTPSTGACYH